LLQGRLSERLRDLTFCRHRLRHLQEALDVPLPDLDAYSDSRSGDDSTLSPSPLPSPEAFWEAIQQSTTTRVVLPNGETDLELAGKRFLTTLTAEHLANLDQVLQDQVLAPLGGLQRALVSGTELMRCLGEPLLNQAATLLGELLPITDVAEAMLGRADARSEQCTKPETGHTLATEASLLPAAFCLDAAAPLVRTDPQVPEPRARSEQSQAIAPTLDFLLIPASEAGKLYGEEAKRSAPQLHLVTVPGQADLMYCREQGFLGVEDVQRLLRPCRPAYEEFVVSPPSSPHARSDISDWMPLDP
jgi:hypothetical protein